MCSSSFSFFRRGSGGQSAARAKLESSAMRAKLLSDDRRFCAANRAYFLLQREFVSHCPCVLADLHTGQFVALSFSAA